MAGYTPGAGLGGIQAVLGSVRLGAVDGTGTAWGLSKLDGWDSADVRTQYTDRQSDHGAWAGRAYLQARVLTAAGTIAAPDQATLEACLDSLQVAASLDDTLLTVYETVPKQVTVRRSGRILIDRATDRLASYSVLLTAADPRKYDVTAQAQSSPLPSTTGGITLPLTLPLTITATTSSGSFVLVNAGTTATRPVLTITGPVTTPTILAQAPDGTVTALAYSDTLQAGDVLVIDCAAHTVTLNGSTSRRRYLSGSWPEIAAGSQLSFSWFASSYDPAAQLAGTCRSAWL
ncbi:phage distal tail protein [Kitasatospora sp. NPDC059571]|uniref:phage distal tail protein n=1 Tax=Kitasatospora sp. NPDC059571 TaxID=3346871 RepID=UPI0036863B37